MTQYIDKEAVIAEIDRRIEEITQTISLGNKKIQKSGGNRRAELIRFLSFLDTLEVKEVDFEREPSKYATKIKPKFHKDEWIVHHGTENIYQVVAVIDNQYQLKYGDTYTVQKCADVDRCARLWDITKDAKDGDVLVCPKYAGDIIPNIFIFKDIKRKDNDVYCYCSFLKTFTTEGYVASADPIDTDFYPATKEQHDILFTKMEEAGYKWNPETKELNKDNENKESNS